MSKIFNALLNTKDSEGLRLSSLMSECDPVPQDSAVQPPIHATAPARIPQPLTDGMASAAQHVGPAKTSAGAMPLASPASLNNIRNLPLRIGGVSPLLPFDETHWYAGEQYRLIRTKILQHPLQPRTIVVTSASSGDGKTVSAVNLAGALSLKADSKILLIDGDLRRPTIHSQLGLPQKPGLTDVLKRNCSIEEALIHTVQFRNLYVLTAGDSTSNPTELLDSPRWRQVCQEIRLQFGYSIIDSPPVGRVADYDLLQAVCDGVVMVIRPDHTNRKLCFKALKTISQKKLIGTILNCTENWFLTPNRQYNSGYYYAGSK